MIRPNMPVESGDEKNVLVRARKELRSFRERQTLALNHGFTSGHVALGKTSAVINSRQTGG